jgi:20S proteasome subunit beta 1
VARSGSAADTQHLVEHLSLELFEMSGNGEKLDCIKTAAHILSSICFENKGDMSTSLLVAGWDDVRGLQLYTISQGGSLIPSKSYALSGSGSSYVYGWCDSAYRSNFNRDECVSFVTEAIELAMQRDGSSGGCGSLLIIEPFSKISCLHLE